MSDHRRDQRRDVRVHHGLRHDVGRLQLEAQLPLVPGAAARDGATRRRPQPPAQVRSVHTDKTQSNANLAAFRSVSDRVPMFVFNEQQTAASLPILLLLIVVKKSSGKLTELTLVIRKIRQGALCWERTRNAAFYVGY